MTEPPRRGSVVWFHADPVQGREQGGRRPAVVVASDGYLTSIPNVIVVLPVTTRDRGLPHHVPLSGRALRLDRSSFAITEQIRTVDRSRIQSDAGEVDQATMDTIDGWLRDWIDL